MGMGIKTWEWGKNHRILNYSKLCDSREFMGSERKSDLLQLLAKSCVCQYVQLPAREYLALGYWSTTGEAPNKLVAGN